MELWSAERRRIALRALAAASLAAVPLAAASPARAALETGPCAVEKQADVPATMRDGTVRSPTSTGPASPAPTRCS